MISIRPANQRGKGGLHWLDARYSFSFADYHDPAHMGFRSLRVLNEDRIAPKGGFATHGHRDMEIITYLLSGSITHEDSSGKQATIKPGTVQRMSAGSGIRHSEFNASDRDELHLLQIWILPEQEGLTPGYDNITFPEAGRRDKWQLIASPDGRDGSLTINQQVEVSVCDLAEGNCLDYPLQADHDAWLQVARGEIDLNGRRLVAGDGAGVEDETGLNLCAITESEIVLFDFK